MGQINYNQNMTAGFPGQAFDQTGLVLTAFNLSPEAKQISTATVGTGGVQTLTLRINGFDITYQGVGAEATATQAQALVDAINANAFVSGSVIAEVSGSDVLVTSRFGGVPFTISAQSGDLTLAATLANAEAAVIPFGRAVVRTGSGTNQEATTLCGLAAAALLTAQVDNLALTYDATVDAIVEIRYYDPTIGDFVTREFAHTQATDAATSITALAAAINGVLPANTVLAEAATNNLTLTAEVAGSPFEVTYGFGPGRDTGAFVHTTNRADATDINRLILGVLQWTATEESTSDANGDSAIPAASGCNVRHLGRIYVESEDASVVGKPVYLRLVANGSLNKLGGFRATPGAGVIRLNGYAWHKELGSKVNGGRNLAVLEKF